MCIWNDIPRSQSLWAAGGPRLMLYVNPYRIVYLLFTH